MRFVNNIISREGVSLTIMLLEMRFAKDCVSWECVSWMILFFWNAFRSQSCFSEMRSANQCVSRECVSWILLFLGNAFRQRFGFWSNWTNAPRQYFYHKLNECVAASLRQILSNEIIEEMHHGKLAASSAATPPECVSRKIWFLEFIGRMHRGISKQKKWTNASRQTCGKFSPMKLLKKCITASLRQALRQRRGAASN